MATVVTPCRLADAFADPEAIRTLIERNGPYPSIASYLPASATRAAVNQAGGTETTLPWFRGNWAVNGHCVVPAAESILNNARFIDAAAQLFSSTKVIPTTVVVNLNAPMGAGAVHVDIPSFRGANRDRYPLPLLQAMGASGLFERWRIVEAGAICWFYDGPGGTYDYWPDGLSGAMVSERPPFHNVALVADNDRMYHRIGPVGDQSAALAEVPASSQMQHVDGLGWTIDDGGRTLLTYPDSQVRLSVLWKAQVVNDDHDGDLPDALTPDRINEVFSADLSSRMIEIPSTTSPLDDGSWIDRLHAIYYPLVEIED